jgi:hypothetical protein
MADKITKCFVEKDKTNKVNQYDLSYEVEHSGKVNTFCIVIKKEEMDDPDDLNEVKSKAKVKAKKMKSDWQDSMKGETIESVLSLVGDTDLS